MTIKATGNHEILVNTGTEGNRGFPSVALLADGGWIVTWHANEQDSGSRGVYQQRFDDSGHPVGVETRVNTTTDGLQGDARPENVHLEPLTDSVSQLDGQTQDIAALLRPDRERSENPPFRRTVRGRLTLGVGNLSDIVG